MVTLQRPTTAIKTNSTTLADKRKNHKNLSLNLTSRRIQPPATTTPAAATPAAIRKAACDNDDNPPSQEPQHLTHYEQGPAQILPNLFLGACHTAQNSAVLERHDISCIINVAHEINSPAPSVSSYHHFKWTHSQNNLARREFQRAIRILENAHRSNVNVLVHCQSGVERSASLVIAYILYLSRNNPLSSVVTKQMSLSEAYDFVRIRAPAIKPNMELMYQLNEFE
ncbi:protein-tyrosine phosphatase-like protein, partial [Zychaea mexicana]|uniref:protein-tyrosine phosphatase-like protein n=1 Tax=Zychaea mexicana TaxID=64656 RepID=UPI0022FE8C64